MKEIWKVYKEFYKPWNARVPKHYVIEVSNYGNVKRNGEIITPNINIGGYRCCHGFKIARAVAELFILNPENKPAVDHIDTNKLNDNVNNLQWVTHTENMNNPLTKIHLSEALKDNPKMNHKGEKNPMYGRNQTDESRKKMSSTRKEKCATGEIVVWSKGKKCIQISNSLKGKYVGENNPIYGRKWMNNGINEILSKTEEIDRNIKIGYQFGRIKI